MLPSGPLGGGVRKSGEKPRTGSSATARSRSRPCSCPLSERSHGTWTAACEGSRSATSDRTSSNIGEIAKRVRTRSSTEKTKRTT
jgi:hypothetical protein